MGVECASCGQDIPPGQLRCGNCGAVQTRDSFDDYGGLTEVPPNLEGPRAPTEDIVLPSVPLATSTASGSSGPASGGPQLAASSAVAAAPTPAPTAAPTPAPTLAAAVAATAAAAVSTAAAVARPLPSPLEEEDGALREPAVPRGTFASEVPERGAPGDERELPRAGEREPAAAKRDPRSGPPNGHSQRIKSVRPVARPPYLASEILREDLTPSEPGRRHLNVTLHVAPALGAVAVLTSGIDRVATWASLAVLAVLFGLTRFELGYHAVAVLVACIGGASLALSAGLRVAMGGGFDGPLLAASATLLPAALLFRTWYRAAYTARVLVTLALVLAIMWATWTSNRGLLALEFDWQSWVPALTWYLFSILCLLSLLAFMSGETTGGCDVWALGVSVWYGLFACARFALEERGLQTANFQTLGLIEPALAAPTAVALAQLFSRVFGTQKRH